MRFIDVSPEKMVSSILALPPGDRACILDSCGVGGFGNNRLIAGIRPVESIEFSGSVDEVLRLLDDKCSSGLAAFFTLSYDFGARIHESDTARRNRESAEPDVFISLYDCIAVHDYDSNRTFLAGNPMGFENFASILENPTNNGTERQFPKAVVKSNFTKAEYIAAIEIIKERIRAGDTYQVNLTQMLSASLPEGFSSGVVFQRLRKVHPAAFAAFLARENSEVVSASPELFIRTENRSGERIITAAPIKGTRPRGRTPDEDDKLLSELTASEKDRAENIMIVDLLRNDLGRICSYGNVSVTSLCEVEEHPTLFHLVSTIAGKMNGKPAISEIIRATFPSGSITGAPKINTMRIISALEPGPRGLSMGAIGVNIPESGFRGISEILEISVAIRTMVFRGREAVFNVGGGIVIDSDPEKEYEESLLKAKALLSAIGCESELATAK